MSKEEDLTSLEKKVTESEYAEIISPEMEHLLKLSNMSLDKKISEFQLPFFLHIRQEAEQIEVMLDNAEAGQNENWEYLRELTATLRWVSGTVKEVYHISGRIKKYCLDPELTKSFMKDTKEVKEFLCDSIGKTLYGIRQESEKLNIKIPAGIAEYNEFDYNIPSSIKLVSTGKKKYHTDEPKIIADVVRDYQIVSEKIKEFGIEGKKEPSQFKRLVGNNGDSENTREIKNRDDLTPSELLKKYSLIMKETDLTEDVISKEIKRSERKKKEEEEEASKPKISVSSTENVRSWLNNIEDDYDTYVRNSSYPEKSPELKMVRGKIGVTLHLMEIARNLIHFYQRHEGENVDHSMRERIDKILDPKKLLGIIINYSVYYSDRYFSSGDVIVNELKNKYRKYNLNSFKGIKDYLDYVDPEEKVKFLIPYVRKDPESGVIKKEYTIQDRDCAGIIDCFMGERRNEVDELNDRIYDPEHIIPDDIKGKIPFNIMYDIKIREKQVKEKKTEELQ